MRILILLILPFFAIAQPPIDRYNQAIFLNVDVSNDVVFSINVPQPTWGGGLTQALTGLNVNADETETVDVDLSMDIYMPAGDTLTKRPLVIVGFGGGFLSGTRDHWSIVQICEELAKRGYVAASIDYRLGMNIFDSDLANRAVYRGLQDGRAAVRFFRADAAGANIYGIDPDNIYMGGHSSGAFIATHNAYLRSQDEIPNSVGAWTQSGTSIPDLGCLDCAGQNQSFSGEARAIFSLAGAVGFRSFIDTADDPKVVMFHSEDDGTVPYDSGEPFGSILWLVPTSDLPVVHGSAAMAERADSVNLPYDFFSYSNRGHDVHEDGSSNLYSDIIPGISDWFFEEELKPLNGELLGRQAICTGDLLQVYELTDTASYYFDWNVTGGTISNLDNYSKTIEVNWDPLASSHQLSVVPFSNLDARGEEVTISIDVLQSGINTYIGTDDAWSNSSNWSQSSIPNSCEDVVIAGVGQSVLLSENAVVNSLAVEPSAIFEVGASGNLTIDQQVMNGNVLEVNGELENEGIIEVLYDGVNTSIYIKEGILINTGTILLRKLD